MLKVHIQTEQLCPIVSPFRLLQFIEADQSILFTRYTEILLNIS